MTAEYLFELIGEVDDNYILSALSAQSQPRRRSRKRALMLLAAAMLAASLLGGCMAYVLSMQNAAIDTFPVSQQGDPDGAVKTIISLQGYTGSPEYSAGKEWYAFLERFTPPQGQTEIPMEERLDYLSYGCFFQEEIDKVDEICRKYALKTIGSAFIEEDAATALEALGLPGLVRQEAPVQADYFDNGLYYYACGIFDASFRLTFTGEDAPWQHALDLRMRYAKKGYFDGVFGVMGPLESYDEWVYTTGQGIPVLLALSRDGGDGRMIAEQEDAFITLNVGPTDAPDSAAGQPLSREVMEAMAECIDFSLRPGDVDLEAAQARREALSQTLLENKSFDDRLQFLADNRQDLSDLVYAMTDLNQDDLQELLIGEGDIFFALYIAEGDATSSPLLDFGTRLQIQVLEENLLLCTETFKDQIRRGLVRLRGADAEYLDYVEYDPQRQEPYSRLSVSVSGEASLPFLAGQARQGSFRRTPITQAEFEAVGADRSAIQIPVQSLQTYLAQVGHVRLQDSWGSYLKTALEEGSVTEASYYALADLDGDGSQELLLGERPDAANQILSLKDGTVTQICAGREVYLCRDGLILLLESFDQYVSHVYYRVEQGEPVLVDHVVWDAVSQQEDTWYRAMEFTDKQPLSEDAYHAVLAEHPTAELILTPVSQYAFP